jgi:hypothetical protein
MSHPNNTYRIAMNLLLLPVSMNVPSVVRVMEVPYATLYKWKRDALSAQVAAKRQGKCTTTTVRLNPASRIKMDRRSAVSQPTRTRKWQVQKVRAISKSLVEDY